MAQEEKKKPWKEFVIELDFDVTEVISKVKPIYTTVGEIHIGGSNRSEHTGDKHLMDIYVSPHSDEVPVRLLELLGSYPIDAGDVIKAYIIAANRIRKHTTERTSIYDRGIRYHWKKRDLENMEMPHKIQKLGEDETILGTYIIPVRSK